MRVVAAGCLLLLASIALMAQPAHSGEWNGYQKTAFVVDGTRGYVVAPAIAAPDRPWLWQARFPDFLRTTPGMEHLAGTGMTPQGVDYFKLREGLRNSLARYDVHLSARTLSANTYRLCGCGHSFDWLDARRVSFDARCFRACTGGSAV